MRRAELLEEIRIMRFEEIYGMCGRCYITQEEAARMLDVSDRNSGAISTVTRRMALQA